MAEREGAQWVRVKECQRQKRERGDSRAPAPMPKVPHHTKGQEAKDLATLTTR